MEKLSYGIVSTEVHEGVQGGGHPAVGVGGLSRGGCPRLRGEPQRAAPRAARVARVRRQGVYRQRTTPWGGRPDRRAGTEGRPPSPGDRFFAAMLAACRGAAEAAGI